MSKRPRRFGAALREAGALLTQARYLSRDLKPTHRAGKGPTVILVHGLYASAGVFRPLRKELTRALDASTYSISYAPGPGIEELSARVAQVVAGIAGSGPIHLVGHSLGGLVCRHTVTHGDVDSRIQQTMSLASPFRGSQKNFLVPGQAGRDIAAGSRLLVELREKSPVNERIPHLTLVAEEDTLILPDAFPEFGDHGLIPRVGHNGILFHEETIRRVVARIAEHPLPP